MITKIQILVLSFLAVACPGPTLTPPPANSGVTGNAGSSGANFSPIPTLTRFNKMQTTEDVALQITYDELLAASDARCSDPEEKPSFSLVLVVAGTLNANPTDLLTPTSQPWSWTPPQHMVKDNVEALVLRVVDSTKTFSDRDVTFLVDIAPKSDAPTLTRLTPLQGTAGVPRLITFSEILSHSDAHGGNNATLKGFKLTAVNGGHLTDSRGDPVRVNAILDKDNSWRWSSEGSAAVANARAFSLRAVNSLRKISATDVAITVNLSANTQLPVIDNIANLAGLEDSAILIPYEALSAVASIANGGDTARMKFKLASINGGTMNVEVGALLGAGTNAWAWTPPLNANGENIAAFSVQLVRADGQTSAAKPVLVDLDPRAPKPLTNLTASATNTEIMLRWTPSPDACGYLIAYNSSATPPSDCKSGQKSATIDCPSSTSTVSQASSKLITNLLPNTQYSFRVCPVDGSTSADVGVFASVAAKTSNTLILGNQAPITVNGFSAAQSMAINSSGASLVVFGGSTIQRYNRQTIAKTIGSAETQAPNMDAADILFSPDNQFVYAIGSPQSTIYWYSINAAGVLTMPAGTNFISAGIASALPAIPKMTLPIDGRHIYVASPGGNKILKLPRDLKTGAIVEANIRSFTDGQGFSLSGVDYIQSTPNGRLIFASSSQSGAITSLARNMNTGDLTQKQSMASQLPGVAALAVDPTGSFLYACSNQSAGIQLFSIDQTLGTLTLVKTIPLLGRINSCNKMVLSGLGYTLLVGGPDAGQRNFFIQAYGRSRDTGELTLRQEIQVTGTLSSLASIPDESGLLYTTSDGKLWAHDQRLPPAGGTARSLSSSASYSVDGADVYPNYLRTRDGRHLYVWNSAGIRLFSVDNSLAPSAGTTTIKTLISNCVPSDKCLESQTTMLGLRESHDGRNVYALTPANIIVLNRDIQTGNLSFASRINISIVPVNGFAWELSRDGQSLYYTSGSKTITKLSRSPGEGTLSGSFAATATSTGERFQTLVLSQDGKFAYTAGATEAKIQIWSRDPENGNLTFTSEADLPTTSPYGEKPVLRLSKNDRVMLLQTTLATYAITRNTDGTLPNIKILQTYTPTSVPTGRAPRSAISDDMLYIYTASTSLLSAYKVSEITQTTALQPIVIPTGSTGPGGICETNGQGWLFTSDRVIDRLMQAPDQTF